ncbi:MAG: hypothetical protein F6J97_05305 [Leptolyngbya sp. SIO4C1]|nr:hypothetical protein [Leptolyngbya sp. SIO4C1]
MFLDELTPIARELLSQPVAFLGGFASGLFRLDLSEDPVKTWLDKQAADGSSPPTQPSAPKGPQTISID